MSITSAQICEAADQLQGFVGFNAKTEQYLLRFSEDSFGLDVPADTITHTCEYVWHADEVELMRLDRQRLATGRPTRLSELGELDAHAFSLFLGLLGEALGEQSDPEQVVERQTGDGLLLLRLEPLAAGSHAYIRTPGGTFSGRDHLLTVRSSREPA